MPFEHDPRVRLDDARKITLGGEEYWIPRLMLRQTIVIGPLMPPALKFINRRADAARPFVEKNHKRGKPVAVDTSALSEAEREELINALALSEDETNIALKIVHAALGRAYPSVTMDDLYDRPINPGELIQALPTIFTQAGTAEKAKGGDKEAKGAPPVGEKQAASR